MALSQKGLHDWIIQRISALVLAGYIFFLSVYFILHPGLDFAMWHHELSEPYLKAATLLTLLALLWHAWIGIWSVLTDYIKNAIVRATLEVIILVALFFYFFWGIILLGSL